MEKSRLDLKKGMVRSFIWNDPILFFYYNVIYINKYIYIYELIYNKYIYIMYYTFILWPSQPNHVAFVIFRNVSIFEVLKLIT